MDRSAISRSEHPAAMRAAGPAALDLLLSAAAGERRQPAFAAEARRVVSGAPVLRQPSHGRHVGSWAHAHPTTDADFGNRSPLSETQSEPSSSGARDLPVLAARRLGREAQPGLEHGYYVPSDAWWLPLPGGHHGLVQPVRAELGTFQHHGDRLLSGCAGGGVPFRSTRNLELRSGFAIHRGGFSGTAQTTRYLHQHGWTGPRPGQRFYRAPVAQSQVRADLPRRLRQ